MIKYPDKKSADRIAKTDYLTRYPFQPLELELDNYATNILTIGSGHGSRHSSDIVVWIDGQVYDGIASTTVTANGTGVGKLVDGQTYTIANARTFLVWAFPNATNTAFSCFAGTHKPYSTYSTNNNGALGSSTTFTLPGGVGLSAYQFTVGARVCCRNSYVGAGPPASAAPLYQVNWGTVTAIGAANSLTVQLDNNATYGSVLRQPNVAGEILQWDMFRPYVITANSQTLYNNCWRLVGEYYTNTSGTIIKAYKVTEPWRSVINNQVVLQVAAQVPVLYPSICRYAPLWSKRAKLYMDIVGNAGTNAVIYDSNANWHTVYIPVNGAYGLLPPNIELYQNAIFGWNGSAATQKNMYLYDYYVPGGMRL
jgi:hypothetical protein